MNSLRKALLPVIVFAKIDIKRLFRDKVAIFFVFLFPLIFLFVFGNLYGANSDLSFNVALINRSDTEFSKSFIEDAKKEKTLKIDEEIKTVEAAKEKMSRGELDATIILPEQFGAVKQGQPYPSGEAEVLYNQSNQQAGQTLGSILESVFAEINGTLVKTETPFTVKTSSTATKGLTQFDYVFAGLLGFSLLSLGIFGPTNAFPRLKQKGVLRRYHTTTLKVWQYFTGNVISNVFVGLLSVATMLTVAITFFDLNMQGNYLTLLGMIILGTIALFGVGLAVGGWAKNENQAAPLGNLVSFPMMFLSGTFFPRFLMPEWLQTVSYFLPLTPIIDGVRLIITEGKTFMDLLPQFGLVALWVIVIYVIAFRVFRWE